MSGQQLRGYIGCTWERRASNSTNRRRGGRVTFKGNSTTPTRCEGGTTSPPERSALLLSRLGSSKSPTQTCQEYSSEVLLASRTLSATGSVSRR
jgi:hypothetical protein